MPPTAPSRRVYDPEELERFAKYVEQRAQVRPRKCRAQYEKCWVREGPPAISTGGVCLGCRGKPLGYSDKRGIYKR